MPNRNEDILARHDCHESPTQLDRIESLLRDNNAVLAELLARKKRKPKPRGSKRVVYWDFFEAVWSDYPKRAGNNPKQKAFAAEIYDQRYWEKYKK